MITPFILALLVAIMPQLRHSLYKRLVYGLAAIIPSVLVLALLMAFDYTASGFQLVETYKCTGLTDIVLGVNMFSLICIVLTSFFVPLCMIIDNMYTVRDNGFAALILVFEGALFGTFLVHNYLWFYLFWEIVLIPLYFLVGIWGSGENRSAATRCLAYNIVSSFALFASLIILTTQIGAPISFNQATSNTVLPPELQWWIFSGILLAVAVRLPLFPLHTWFTDTLASAPLAAGVLMIVGLTKTAIYAFIYLAVPQLPVAAAGFLVPLTIAGGITLIYAGLLSAGDEDPKRMVAYAFICQTGLMMLGLFSTGTTQATSQTALYFSSAASAGLALILMATRAALGEKGTTNGAGLLLITVAVLGFVALPGSSAFFSGVILTTSLWKQSTTLGILSLTGLLLCVAFSFRTWRILSSRHTDNGSTNAIAAIACVPVLLLAFILGLMPPVLFDLFQRISPYAGR